MEKTNCFMATVEGLSFQFSPGIKVDAVIDDQLVVNGFGTMLFISSKKVTDDSIEAVFADEKEEVWVGEKDDEMYIYQAAVTLDNAFIVPLSRYPKFCKTKYIKLLSPKEALVMVIGGGRVLSRIFTESEQVTFLELENESVVTVEAAGSTAIFECTEKGFKIS